MSKSSPKYLLVLLAVGLGACDLQPVEVDSPVAILPPDAVASVAPTQGALLAQIRAATARYHRVEVAKEDGYERRRFPFPPFDPIPCIEAEGIRYGNLSLIDGVVDPTRPELLLYEPLPNGKLRLAGVQFLVVCPAWLVARGCESPGELVVATQANRKAPRATGALKEAASESASRRTETG
jgi:hypothetical protein